MPIIGTPVASAPTVDTLSGGLAIVRPLTSTVEGRRVPARMRGVAVSQGQPATVELDLRSQDGNTIDTADIQIDGRVTVRILEALSFSTQVLSTEIEAEMVDDAGIIRFTLTDALVAYPGVSLCDIGVFNSLDRLLFTNQLYLYVNRGQFGAITDRGPPTINEIRLRLRDSSSEDNFLLDRTEFDIGEIADAVVQTVDAWNSTPPPISQRFNTASFPFPSESFMGIVGKLYQTAALHYLREDVVYSAAGIAFDDKRKVKEYEEVGVRRWMAYINWVKLRKVARNALGGMTTSGSPYSRLFY